MRRLAAFLRRDLLVATSYRPDLALTLVGGGMTLTVFYFLARTVGDSPALARSGDYFSFALVGIAVAAALRSVQTSFASRLRDAQSDGSLELLLATPLGTLQVIAGLAAYPILSALARAVALLAAGGWLFGGHLSVDVPACLAALALSIAAFAPLGLLSAAFVLVFKRGDPFSYALDVASYLLCGVIYPIEVLPPALRLAAQFLPATHALEALRGAVLHHAGATALLRPLGALAVFAALAWPLAAVVLTAARRHAEKAGTLGQS